MKLDEKTRLARMEQRTCLALLLPKTGNTFASKHVSFGSNRLNIPVTAYPFRPGELGFPVQCRAAGKGRWHLPPLIGILTSEHPSIPGFRGNKANFRDIVETGRRMGVLVFVFTPNGVRDSASEIVGFTRHPAVKGWVRLSFPKPHVVYNRIPDRKAERQPAEQKTLRMFLESEDTRLFNPRFFNKEELWHWTANDDTLKYLQPVTEIWGDQATLTRLFRPVQPVVPQTGQRKSRQRHYADQARGQQLSSDIRHGEGP